MCGVVLVGGHEVETLTLPGRHSEVSFSTNSLSFKMENTVCVPEKITVFSHRKRNLYPFVNGKPIHIDSKVTPNV